MAQAGFTPIITYHSTTPAAVPTAGNLAPGELALNIADMKLYCENSSGVVTLLAEAGGGLTGETQSTTPFETSLGSGAGAVNTGVNNTFVGFEAGNDNTTGANNTAVGYQALDANTTANNSTAVGYGALTASTGDSNAAFGYNAGAAITTGVRNTCIGDGANGNGTTGSDNVLVGSTTNLSAVGDSNSIVIGTAGGSTLTGKGGSTGFISPGGGGVYQGNNSSSWSTTSDQRLKKNIVDNTEGLEKINAIRVRNFEYRLPEEVTDLPEHTAIKKEGIQLGVIAQELQQVCPDCVKEESTGVLSVDSDNVFWHMVNAIKELSAQVTALQAEVNTLKGL